MTARASCRMCFLTTASCAHSSSCSSYPTAAPTPGCAEEISTAREAETIARAEGSGPTVGPPLRHTARPAWRHASPSRSLATSYNSTCPSGQRTTLATLVGHYRLLFSVQSGKSLSQVVTSSPTATRRLGVHADQVEVPQDLVVRLRAEASGAPQSLHVAGPARCAGVIHVDIVDPRVPLRARENEGRHAVRPSHGHQLHRPEDHHEPVVHEEARPPSESRRPAARSSCASPWPPAQPQCTTSPRSAPPARLRCPRSGSEKEGRPVCASLVPARSTEGPANPMRRP